MSDALPPFYFRVRDGGAQVFRVAHDPRTRRLEMEPLAVVKLDSGEIRPQGDRVVGADDEVAIRDWIAQRRQDTARVRDLDDVQRSVDLLGRTAHWAQARASDDELDAVTDTLLLAMHDLRAVLVRRKAARLDPGD